MEAVDLHGRPFIAGFMGINNIKANNYANVVLQLLLHLPPLRDLCLSHDFRTSPSPLCMSPLTPPHPRPLTSHHGSVGRTLGEACRKIWNPRAFKAILSPHEFLQAVSIASERRYSLNKSADALEFLTWLLNTLEQHAKTHHQSTILGDALRGKVRVRSKRLRVGEMGAASMLLDDSFVGEEGKVLPFLYLSLDLPPTPLYQSITGEYAVPQVDIQSLLEKYDGGRLTQRGELVQVFALEFLPPHLILNYGRISQSHLVWQKNQTLVNYPVQGLQIIDLHGRPALYDLLANICHTGDAGPGKGHYLVHLLNQASGRWYEIDDLHVREIPAVNVPLADCYIQLWRKRSVQD